MRFVVAVLLALLTITGSVFAQHFDPVEPTGRPWAVVCTEATINGFPLTAGDEIGVFDGELCVGASVVTEEIDSLNVLSVVTWEGGDTLGLPGFTPGHDILFRIWYAAGETEVEATPTFVQGDGTFGNGPYAMVTLEGTLQAGIQGTVTECTDEGPPIEGVDVYLNNEPDPRSVTDADGHYEIMDLLPGNNYNLRFEHTWHLSTNVNGVQATPDITVADAVMTYPDATVPTDPVEMIVYIIWFGSDSTGTVNFDMESAGCANLNWTASVVDPQQTWLSIRPNDGMLPVGETVTLTARADLRDVEFDLEHGMDIPAQIAFDGNYWENPPVVDLVIHLINSVGEGDDVQPGEYALHQNYPNPFNPVTEIRFDLVKAQNVHLGVYNLVGQEVAKLVEGMRGPGSHSVAFDASTLPSGIYLYRLETPEFQDFKKMLLVK